MKESTRKKLDRLYQKVEDLDNRIKRDTAERRNLLHQINEIENTEIFSIIRKNKLSLEIVCGDLELGQKLREAGITQANIEELLVPKTFGQEHKTTDTEEEERNML